MYVPGMYVCMHVGHGIVYWAEPIESRFGETQMNLLLKRRDPEKKNAITFVVASVLHTTYVLSIYKKKLLLGTSSGLDGRQPSPWLD